MSKFAVALATFISLGLSVPAFAMMVTHPNQVSHHHHHHHHHKMVKPAPKS